MGKDAYEFRLADGRQELQQIHRLLYQTFVKEIPRYSDPGTDYLVDKFHDRNHYLIAAHGTEIVGMVALHAGPTFSVSNAMPDAGYLDQLVPPVFEARIFAASPRHRRGIVFAGLAAKVIEFVRDKGGRHLLICGLEKRRPMYEAMGFRQIGSPVQAGQAMFVPMHMDVASLPARIENTIRKWRARSS